MAGFPIPGFKHISVNPQPLPGFSPVDIQDKGFVPGGYGIDIHSQPAGRRSLENHFATKEFAIIQSVNSIDASPYFDQTAKSPASASVKYWERLNNTLLFNSPTLVDKLYQGYGTTVPLTLQGVNKILAGESGSGTATKDAVLDRQKAHKPIKFSDVVLDELRSDAMNMADKFQFLGVFFTWQTSNVISTKAGLDCKTRNMWDMLESARLSNGTKLYLLYQTNGQDMMITPAIQGPVPGSFYTPYVLPDVSSTVVRQVGSVHRAAEKNKIKHVAGGFADVGLWEQLVMTDINIYLDRLPFRVDEDLVRVPRGFA